MKHHTRYLKQRKEVAESGRNPAEFDDVLIAQGLLLPSRRGRTVAEEDDVFAQVAAEFLHRDAVQQSPDVAATERALHESTKSARDAEDAGDLAAEAAAEARKEQAAEPKGGSGRKKVGKKATKRSSPKKDGG